MDYTHEFHEQGNGFPSIGDDVIVHHDECGGYGLAKVASISSIHTKQWQSNWIYLTLEDSGTDWDSLDEQEQDRLYDSLHHVKPLPPKWLTIVEIDHVIEDCELDKWEAPNEFLAALVKEAIENGTATHEDSEGCPVTATVR